VGGPPAWGLGGGLTTLLRKTHYLLRITTHSLGSIVVPIHKKGDKTNCSNYRGISLLSTSYKILSNILLPMLIPYADEIIGDHQCGFRRNRSTTDQIFYIRQILEKSGSIMAQYISYL
jgi:hypothetical protein